MALPSDQQKDICLICKFYEVYWGQQLNWQRVVTVNTLQDLLTLLIPSRTTTVEKTWTSSAKERYCPPPHPNPPHVSHGNMYARAKERYYPPPHPKPQTKKRRKCAFRCVEMVKIYKKALPL